MTMVSFNVTKTEEYTESKPDEDGRILRRIVITGPDSSPAHIKRDGRWYGLTGSGYGGGKGHQYYYSEGYYVSGYHKHKKAKKYAKRLHGETFDLTAAVYEATKS